MPLVTDRPKKKMQHTNMEPWSNQAQPKRPAQKNQEDSQEKSKT
jgi:hypothetical protein